MRPFASLALLFAGLSLAAPAGGAPVDPELQLCLLHLRAGERARAEKALGPLENLPLYQADLSVDPKTRTVRGTVRVRLVVGATAQPDVLLRVTPNAFVGDQLRLSELTLDGVAPRVDRPEPTLYRLVLASPAPAGSTVQLAFKLEGKVPRARESAMSLFGGMASAGAERTDHGAFSAAPDAMSLVGVLPGLVPRTEDGTEQGAPTGIGDLSLYAPANYLVSVKVPAGYAAHATGQALGEVPERGGEVRFSFGAAVVRDFPLLVTRGFEVASRSVGDLTIESYFAPGSKRAGKRALAMAADALTELEKRLGPIPWKVFRIVEAPLAGGAGGMEFPGLVTISRGLYDAAEHPEAMFGGGALAALGGAGMPDLGAMFEQTLDFTVAHEVAHQYFAGMVGSDPIQHPVVDEALAQHTALLVIEWTRGKPAADAIRQQQLVTAYQYFRLSGGEDAPADRPTDAFDNELAYGAIVYGKAPLLHDEERKLIGDRAYVAGLRAYVDAYRHRWACPNCLTQTLARLNPTHAAALMALRHHWLDEANGDRDLGKPDLRALVKQVGGADIPPEALELLEQLLPQLAE